MIDTTFASDNLVSFRKNPLERIWKLIITIDYKTRNEKLKYGIKREAVNISALSSSKTYKYEYLANKEILQPYQSRVIEKANFTYYPLDKAFEKQIRKQIYALKSSNQINHIY